MAERAGVVEDSSLPCTCACTVCWRGPSIAVVCNSPARGRQVLSLNPQRRPPSVATMPVQSAAPQMENLPALPRDLCLSKMSPPEVDLRLRVSGSALIKRDPYECPNCSQASGPSVRLNGVDPTEIGEVSPIRFGNEIIYKFIRSVPRGPCVYQAPLLDEFERRRSRLSSLRVPARTVASRTEFQYAGVRDGRSPSLPRPRVLRKQLNVSRERRVLNGGAGEVGGMVGT